jgi:hypothetical protein
METPDEDHRKDFNMNPKLTNALLSLLPAALIAVGMLWWQIHEARKNSDASDSQIDSGSKDDLSADPSSPKAQRTRATGLFLCTQCPGDVDAAGVCSTVEHSAVQ